ncbi:MAG: acetate--CoA ligase [Lautropia sp.]|nr:acetate--CoA ligase [Lautropia sp.]
MSMITPACPESLTRAEYEARQAESLRDPAAFWRAEAKRLQWRKFPDTISDVDYRPEHLRIRWFADGELNVSVNCLDRHLDSRAGQTALIGANDEPGEVSRRLNYRQLYELVCRLGNALRSLGVDKGDRVTIYMPTVPEAAAAMLACARIGAIHCVVFGGFSPTSLADRIRDSQSRVVITADGSRRAGRTIPLKTHLDAALQQPGCDCVKNVLVLRHIGLPVSMQAGRDHWLIETIANQPADCPPEHINAEDPLFILYTSGSTGKPKGLVHTAGGYLVYAAFTHEYVFGVQPGDVFWCTADIGWITGHTYMVYAPLCNGTTSLLFDGSPTHPDAGRFWNTLARHEVSVLYTVPTTIRALMKTGTTAPTGFEHRHLRLLASAGEPLDPKAWRWFQQTVGDGTCPIIDTWWQTETGGILLASTLGSAPKPGAVARPLPAIDAQLVDDNAEFIPSEQPGQGLLVITNSWPGQARTMYRDHARFVDTCFRPYPGMFYTSDAARRDEDGDYWITGRVDDVINIGGTRLSTVEVESALVSHPAVAEVAAVSCHHPVRGQGIYLYVLLVDGLTPSEELRQILTAHLRQTVSPLAAPDHIHWVEGLPKTRSGKIMRRILRKIAENAPDQLGDTSTLADPSVVDRLLAERLVQ